MGKEIKVLEFEAGKEKKKCREKGKKGEPDKNSSLVEVGGDKMGKVVDRECHDNNSQTHMNSEGANKRKKRKMEKEWSGIAIRNDGGEQTTADGNKDLETVDVDDGKKKEKKAKTKEHIEVEDSNRNMEAVDVDDGKKRKKKKKKKKGKSNEHVEVEDSNRDIEAVSVEDSKNMKKKSKSEKQLNVQDCDNTEAVTVDAVNVDDSKKRKKTAKSEKQGNVEDCNGDSEVVVTDAVDVKYSKRRKKSTAEKHEDCNKKVEGADVKDGKKRKRETKMKKHVTVEDCNEEKKKKSLKSPKSARTSNHSATQKVSFAEDVEVFPTPDDASDKHEGLVRGKRFSEEEDKIVKEAVLRYIEENELGAEGLDMVLRCQSHPEVKNHPEVRKCWKVIGEALPWRPFKSVYYRAHILFERAEERNWTPEEYEQVRTFHKDHGADWRKLGDSLGKHRIHVKDAWRRIKLPNKKKGHWSQEEYETLFDLVNLDLRMKVFEEKKTKHGMLRDNISWEAISEKLGTRTNPVCSMKWYNQLASPLVSQKLWSDVDDYRLVDALNRLDACCIEDVDWDDLLEHRPGDICLKRWNQMVKHIGHYGLKTFSEQVEVLSKRYCPDLIETREAIDSKPVVD